MEVQGKLPRGCLRLVEVVLLLDVLVLSANNILGPVVLQDRFAKKFGHPDWSESDTVCNVNSSKKDIDKMITSHAATWNYYVIAIQFTPAIFIALIMGTLSDRLGRRPMMLVGTFGIFVGSLFTYLFQQFELPLETLLLGGFLQGASGGQAVVLTTILAYIVDDCSEESRTIRLTIAEAIMWVMSGVGQALAGYMTTNVSVISACILVLAVLVVQFLYIIIILRESLALPAGEAAKVVKSSIIESIKALFRKIHKVFIVKSNYRGIVWTLMIVDALIMTIVFGTSGLDVLYFMQKPFCLTSEEASYIGLATAITFCFYGLVIAPILVKITKVTDITLCQIGIIFYMISRAGMGFSYSEWMLYVSVSVGMPAVAVSPVVRSMVSKEIEGTNQGTLFSMVASLETVATIVGSVLYGSLFSFFINHSIPVAASSMSTAGYTYFIQGIVILIAAAMLFAVIYVKKKRKSTSYEPITDDYQPITDDAGIAVQ